MIKHVYLIQLNDRGEAPAVMERIRSLKDHIPQLHRVEVGQDFVGAAASYDIIEICEFLTREDFDIFTAHPYHDQIRRYISAVKKHAVKVDYVVD